MGLSLGELIYTVAMDSKDFEKGLTESEKKMLKFSETTEAVGKKMTTALTLPILAAGAASLKLAADAETAGKKFEGTFSGQITEATEAIKMLNQQYGISSTQAKELLANSGSLVKSFGATSAQALDFSKQVQVLAAALSATNGVPIAETSDKITKAMLGETEGMKTLGVAINATAIEAQLLAKGQQNLTGDSLQLAKAQAVLDIAYKQSADDLKTFESNTGSASYTTQVMLGDLKDLSVQFGNILLPVLKDVVSGLTVFIRSISALDEGQLKLIVTFAGVVAAIGPILVGIANVQKAIVLLNTSALLGPAGIIVGIGLAIAAFAKLISMGKEARENAEQVTGIISGSSTGDLNKDLDLIGKKIKDISQQIAQIKNEGLAQGYEADTSALEEELAKLKEVQKSIVDKQKWNKMNEISAKQQAESAKKEAEAQALSAEAIAEKQRVEKKYLDARAKVLDILESEKTASQKIREEIEQLDKTKWGSGQLEEDRLAAIAVLEKRFVEAQKEEAAAVQAKVDEVMTIENEWHLKVLEQSEQTLELIEIEKQAAIKAAQEKGASIENIEKFYADKKAAAEKEAADKAKAKAEADKKEAEAKDKEILASIVSVVEESVSVISMIASGFISEISDRMSLLGDQKDDLNTAYDEELDRLNERREALIAEGKSTEEVDAEISNLTTEYKQQTKKIEEQIAAQKKLSENMNTATSFITGTAKAAIQFASGDYIGGAVTALTTLFSTAVQPFTDLLMNNPELQAMIQYFVDSLGKIGIELAPVFISLLKIVFELIDPFMPVLILLAKILNELMPIIELLINVCVIPLTTVLKILEVPLNILINLVSVIGGAFEWLAHILSPFGTFINNLANAFYYLLDAINSLMDKLFGWIEKAGKNTKNFFKKTGDFLVDVGKGVAHFFGFEEGGEVHALRAATGMEVNAAPGGVPILAAENGYDELLFNAGPSGDSFREQFASEVAEFAVRGLASLNDNLYNRFAEAINNIISGTTQQTSNSMNLTVVIEGMGEATIPITQEALQSGKILVPSRVIV
jgi:hypothetical protein